MVHGLYKSLFAIWVICAGGPAAGAGGELPASSDLRATGAGALQRRLPIVLEFSAADCDYCRQLEREFLVPMLISGEYADRAIIRRLPLDSGRPVTDFDGSRKAAADIAGRYQVRLTPTLLFLDGHGNELAVRIIGINTPELFGGYLDACIDTALLKLREPDSTVVYAGCDAIQAPAP